MESEHNGERTHFKNDDDEENVEEPTVMLKEAVDLNELMQGEGTEFEVKDDDYPQHQEYFDNENIFNQINIADTCGPDEESSGDEDFTPFEKLGKQMQDLLQDGSGNIQKRILKPGSGEKVPPTARITVHYNAYLEYADEPYDSTRLRNKPESYILGNGQMFPGFEIAVSSMKKGEESQFIISPQYVYGDNGCPPRIPPKAYVMFVIELLHFVNREGVDDYYSLTGEEKRNATLELVLPVVKMAREEGNQLFGKPNFFQAQRKYERAQRLLEDCRLKDEAEEIEQRKHLLKIYLNLAICNLKMCQSARCISYCNRVLEMERGNTKALYRKGKALHQLGEFERAKKDLLEARRSVPNNPEINQELRRLEQSVEKCNLMHREMCQKMFSKKESNDGKETAQKSCDKKQPTSTQECSDEWKTLVQSKLQDFKVDDNLMEFNLPALNFSRDEIACVYETATSLGLDVKMKEEGSTMTMKVLKKAPVTVED